VRYNFVGDLPINEDHKNIYILASGFTLDLFLESDEWKGVTRDNSIIITVNGSMSICKPTIQVCADKWGVEYWAYHEHNDNKVIWIGRPRVKEYDKHPCNWIQIEDIVKNAHIGISVVALQVAYYIWYYYNIENIFYTGIDMSEIIIKQDKFSLAYSLKGMPGQVKYQVPKCWMEDNYRIVKTQNKSYLTQLKGLSMFRYDSKFCDTLRSRSMLDITKLNERKHDIGYSEAIQDNYYKLGGKHGKAY
jgi:hypothetical protein